MARPWERRSEAGGSVVSAVVLLGVLVGLGAWNFKRNLDAEAEVYRPFRSYSDQEVSDLRAATEAQNDRDSARHQRAAGRKVSVQGKDYYAEQVGEFERVQRISQEKRALRDRVAGSQATLKLLQAEERQRAAERQKWRLFLKRVFTVNP